MRPDKYSGLIFYVCKNNIPWHPSLVDTIKIKQVSDNPISGYRCCLFPCEYVNLF